MEKHKGKIYDCFTFFNELDLLELRLEELYNSVDFFVIAEATKTFSGEPKRLFFNENKHRFEKYNKKIIHLIIDDMPKINNFDQFLVKAEQFLPRNLQLLVRKFLRRVLMGKFSRYKMIEHQRKSIFKSLSSCKDEDIILGVDIDEIPRKEKFEEMRRGLKNHKFIEFYQLNYVYFFNGLKNRGPGTRACYYKTLKKDLSGNLDYLRTLPFYWKKMKLFTRKDYYVIKDGGWHFSYLGGVKTIKEKLKSLEHPEAGKQKFQSESFLNKCIESGEFPFSDHKINYVKIDKSFPKTILKNMSKYKDYIKNKNE